MRQFLTTNIDLFGFFTSMLCAMHCSILPLAIAFGLVGGMAWMDNHMVEVIFIASTVIIATWAIANSYLKHHRNLFPLILVVIGFALILTGYEQHTHDGNVRLLSTLGGLSVAAGHIINWMLISRKSISLEK